MIGKDGSFIRRLETGERRLTTEEMRAIATALKVRPADLISSATLAEAENEVVPFSDPSNPLSALSSAWESEGRRVFRVTEFGKSMALCGIGPGDVIFVNVTPERIAAVQSLDLVLVRFTCNQGRQTIVLRQFLAPSRLVTARGEADFVISLNDKELRPEIVGVIVRKDGGS
jgi:hypothetical protein